MEILISEHNHDRTAVKRGKTWIIQRTKCAGKLFSLDWVDHCTNFSVLFQRMNKNKKCVKQLLSARQDEGARNLLGDLRPRVGHEIRRGPDHLSIEIDRRRAESGKSCFETKNCIELI